MRDRVAQAVMASMATALLQAHRADRQVELIMRDQDLFGRNLVELAQLANRQAAAIHISRRLEQHHFVSLDADLRGLARIFSIVAKLAAMAARKQVHEPETRVMPGHLMFRAWIAQADDDAQR